MVSLTHIIRDMIKKSSQFFILIKFDLFLCTHQTLARVVAHLVVGSRLADAAIGSAQDSMIEISRIVRRIVAL